MVFASIQVSKALRLESGVRRKFRKQLALDNIAQSVVKVKLKGKSTILIWVALLQDLALLQKEVISMSLLGSMIKARDSVKTPNLSVLEKSARLKLN